MRYLILSLGIIGFSMFVQNNNTTYKSLGMEPVCDTEHQFYKIILGSNLDHIQNQRIAYAKNNHTNNTKYVFIGKTDEQVKFKNQMNKIFYNKSKPNIDIMNFDSENTAQHIMCFMLKMLLTNIGLYCNNVIDYVNVSAIDQGIIHVNLPVLNIYISDYHKERFLRIFNIIKYQLRVMIGINVNYTNMNIIEAVTVNHHKGWLTKLEEDIHNNNIISDIEKSKKNSCGQILFN